MAKKRFGIDQVTNQALSETMQMAKQNDSYFNNTIIPLGKIKLDFDNPRKHNIKQIDLMNGPANHDPDYKIKMREYESLQQLALSINKEGLLHPIIVYKDGDHYKLVAGERRFFASIIAGKGQIEARVFKNKPKSFDLKIIQWTENESRENLALDKRLGNIQAIIQAYLAEKKQKITGQALADLLSISRPLAQCYLSILANSPLLEVIQLGKIKTVRDARELAPYKTKTELEKAINLLLKKQPLPEKLKPVISQKQKKQSRAGRKRKLISLGTTRKGVVVKALVESVLTNEKFRQYRKQFEEKDWASKDDATTAFQDLIKILERELG